MSQGTPRICLCLLPPASLLSVLVTEKAVSETATGEMGRMGPLDLPLGGGTIRTLGKTLDTFPHLRATGLSLSQIISLNWAGLVGGASEPRVHGLKPGGCF